jgi:hypothetical protein
MVKKSNEPTIKIELTQEQMEQIRQATGKEMSTLELGPEMLEERIAPRCITKSVDKSTPL